MPAVSRALAVASLLVVDSEMPVMDGKRSVVLVMCVDVEVAGPGPCIEPRGCFLDLKTFLYKRFISLMVDVEDRDIDYVISRADSESNHKLDDFP